MSEEEGEKATVPPLWVSALLKFAAPCNVELPVTQRFCKVANVEEPMREPLKLRVFAMVEEPVEKRLVVVAPPFIVRPPPKEPSPIVEDAVERKPAVSLISVPVAEVPEIT